MSGLLVAGKIQSILDRWTATKAGYLDAAITSRASAANLSTLTSNVATVDTNVDAIKAVTDTILDVPLTIVGYRADPESNVSLELGNTLSTGSVSCGGTQNAYTSVISVTANGVITGLGVFTWDALAQDYQFRFVVDGTTVYTSASNFWASGDSTQVGAVLVRSGGGASDAVGGPSSLRFKTSFAVDVRCTSASAAANFRAVYCYYTVA